MLVETLDELIAQLTEMRKELPGTTPVRLTTHGRKELLFVEVGQGRVGKATPHQRVSRGGDPVVLLME